MSHPVTGLPGATDEAAGVARGLSNASLAPVWQLNALFLETIVDSSRHPTWVGSPWETALGSDLTPMPRAVREELCRSPVSLVDVGLSSERPDLLLNGVGGARNESPPPFLPRDRAVHLAQETLILAWTLARSDAVATSIVFGVSRSQVRGIRALAFHGIPAIAEKLAGTVQPRWLTQPRIWQRLLDSSERSIGSHLAPRHIRILQRQLADLLPATAATRLLHASRL